VAELTKEELAAKLAQVETENQYFRSRFAKELAADAREAEVAAESQRYQDALRADRAASTRSNLMPLQHRTNEANRQRGTVR
jgi:hypothetical protein